jgi:hypothetical protein
MTQIRRSIQHDRSSTNRLDPDDSVTVSVSHQIYINGDQSWVKLEVTGHVREEEESSDAIARVHQEVLHNLMGIIEDNVTMVESQGAKK